MQLQACESCRRHVSVDEDACPFCGAAIAVSPRPSRFARRLSRAAIFAGATFAGCHPKEPPAPTIVSAPAPADAGVVTSIDARPIDARPADAPVDAAPPPIADAAVAHTGRIKVIVFDVVDRKRRRRASIQLHLLRDDGRPIGVGGHTALDGTFVFEQLEAGSYSVLAVDEIDEGRHKWERTAQRPATVRDNEQAVLELTLGPREPRPLPPPPCCMPYGAPPSRRRVV
jgi:hypothetical protein